MIGFRINEDFERKGKEYFEEILTMDTCLVSDGMNNFNTMHHSIKPIDRKTKFIGNALTVRLRASDNLMLHKAIDYAKKGDILVIDTCGSESNSIIGDHITNTALAKGVAGIIVDGGIRDIIELDEQKAPVFYRFITPAVGDKDGPGEIGYRISCGSVSVDPGDIIFGDGNGVVVIKPDEIEEVVKQCRKKLVFEKKRTKEIQEGKLKRDGIDEILKVKGII